MSKKGIQMTNRRKFAPPTYPTVVDARTAKRSQTAHAEKFFIDVFDLKTLMGLSSLVTNVKQAIELINELGLSGRYLVKKYKDTEIIIVKGFRKTNQIIKSPRFKSFNPKLIALGIGKVGINGTILKNSLLTVGIYTSYECFKFFFNSITNDPEVSQLLGTLAILLAEGGATAILYKITAIIVMGGTVTIAHGPLVAIIVVSIASTFILDSLVKRYDIEQKLTAKLKQVGTEIEKSGATYMQQITNHVETKIWRLIGPIGK